MKSLLEPGKYVVAVSGGVDSMVLLHMLQKDTKLDLVVAHFDHGIRKDSKADREFVEKIAREMDLPFVYKRAELGANASEAEARKHRYEFLFEVLKEIKADAIVTAHHQDDLIETALLNILRGTKRRGVVSLKSTDSIKRPLLDKSKAELIEYAQKNKLQWREDETNRQLKYRRNKIRQKIKDSLTDELRGEIVALLRDVEAYNREIDKLVDEYLASQPKGALKRQQLNKLYLVEAYEIAAGWLRQNNVAFDAETIKRMVIGARILQNGSQIDLAQDYYCRLEKDLIVLERRSSV